MSVKIGIVEVLRPIPEDLLLPLTPEVIGVYASEAGVELVAGAFVLCPTAARALAALLEAAAKRAEGIRVERVVP